MTQPRCGAKGENDRAGRDRYAALFQDRLHPHSEATYGYWQTVFAEGFFEVPAGQTVQLNVNLHTGSGKCMLANAVSDSDAYTSVIAWPL